MNVKKEPIIAPKNVNLKKINITSEALKLPSENVPNHSNIDIPKLLKLIFPPVILVTANSRNDTHIRTTNVRGAFEAKKKNVLIIVLSRSEIVDLIMITSYQILVYSSPLGSRSDP